MSSDMSRKQSPSSLVQGKVENPTSTCSIPVSGSRHLDGNDLVSESSSPSADVSKEELLRRAALVQSIYDSMETGENRYRNYSVFRKSQLFQKVGLIHQIHDHQITRYLYMTVTTSLFFKCETNWVGYIAMDDSVAMQRSIVVVFRGTITKSEWWKDLMAKKTQFPFVKEECNVHSGFNSLYSSKNPKHPFGDKSLRDQVNDELTNIVAATPSTTKVRITIAGHSLGGALTALAACDIGYNFAPQHNNILVSAFTFGSPKVGDKTFKQIAESHAGIIRFENVGDLIPKLPPSIPPWNYVAVGSGQIVLWAKSPYVKEDLPIRNKHDLELSMHGISLAIIPQPLFAVMEKDIWFLSVEDLSKELTKGGGQEAIDQLESIKSLFGDEEGNIDVGSLHRYLVECVYVSRTQKEFRLDPSSVDYALVNKWQDSLKPKLEVPPSWWVHSNKDVQQDKTGKWLPRFERPEDDPIPSNPEYN